MVTTYLLREPVKEAVREALREEGLEGEGGAKRTGAAPAEPEGSGAPVLPVAVALLALGGLAYVLRRRRRSEVGWSAGTGSTAEAEPYGGSSSAGGSGGSTTTVSDEG